MLLGLVLPPLALVAVTLGAWLHGRNYPAPVVTDRERELAHNHRTGAQL